MAVSPVPMYTAFLQSLGCEIDAEDKVSFVMPDGSTTPVTLEGKRLVIPTPEMLKRIDNSVHVAYHPMAEQVTRNESPVQRKLRTIINVKATFVLGSLMQDLTELAISDKKERTSKSEYFELFAVMKDATPKTLQSVKSLVSTLEVDGLNKRLVHFASKRGGKLNGKPYRRITTVSFPILDQFSANAPADHIFDVKVSKKDKAVIFELLKYIIPKLQTADAYSAGSDGMDAPMFVSMAQAWANFMEDINVISWRYKDTIANFTYCNTEIKYLDQLDKVSTFVGFIPSLEGNEGTTQLTNKSTGVTAQVGGLTPAMPTAAAPAAPLPTLGVVGSPMTLPTVVPTLTPPATTSVQPTVMPATVSDGPLRPPNLSFGLTQPVVNPNPMGNPWGQNTMGYTAPGTYLPPGTVMGLKGNPINLMTATIDELEQNLDPATFASVYAQRQQAAAMQVGMQGVQAGMQMGMNMGNMMGMGMGGWR